MRIKEFLISSWEWIAAGIGVLGLFLILVCYVFGLTVFILRTFF